MNDFTTENSSRLKNLAGRLEEAWNSQSDSSKGIDLEPFLPESGNALRKDALFELVRTDLACRWSRGLPTSLELYVEKFPEIGPIEKVSPRLIYEEYRIRTQNGYPAPLSQYKTRFPAQFEAFEGLIQTEASHIEIGSKTEATGVTGSGDINTNLPTLNHHGPVALLKQGALVGGHYTLTKRIGTGGFGEVWLGNDIHGNIPKAIKIISRSVESEEAKQELHALEIIKRLNHPYLLRTEGFFAEQERLIVVMELADGSLRELLKKSKKENDSGLPVDKLIGYMKHAAEALDYLHEEGIFHRDIKPENILLVGKIAKVADFGLAKLAQNRQSTKTNFAGTSAYSSPETWKGRVTSKSDLYSLAVTYGELRLARVVFKGSTIYEFMVEHLQSQPQLDPMPEAEQQVMLRALAKDPADRFANCSEFVRALEAAVGGKAEVLPSVGKQSIQATKTPVSKWSTPVSQQTQPSLNLATQYGKSVKPTSWQKSPSKADLDLAEMETSSVRRRRKKTSRMLLIGLGAVAVFILLALGAGGASLMARGSLQSTVNGLVEKRDFDGALKAIDNGGILTSPYQEAMRGEVLDKGLEMAEKAKKSDQLDDLIATAAALVKAFPKDDKAPRLVEEALQTQIPDLLRREKYSEAYNLLFNLPLDVPSKRNTLSEISRAWLGKAWNDLDNEDYTGAKRTTAALLKIDPGQKEALAIDNLAQAAENVKTLLLKGKFRELMDRIRDTPPAGNKLAKQLREEVKTAWLKHAEAMVNANNFEGAQRSLESFGESFRNDPKGNALLKSSYSGLLKEYFAQDKYEDALNMLAKNNFQFPDLVDIVKRNWSGAEAKRFEEGGDDDKARALQALAKLSRQFATDSEVQDFYSKYREAYVSALLPKIDTSMRAKNYSGALALIDKAEPYVAANQETRLRSMQLLAMLKDTETPLDKKAAERLFKQVMKQPEKADKLDDVVVGVLAVCKNDPAFAAALRPTLQSLLDFLPEDRLPANFYADSGITRTIAPPSLGSRKILTDAKKLYQGQDFEQSLKTLRQFDLAKEDKDAKREYYTLYAMLGEKGVLTRDQVHSLEKAAGEFGEIKPYLAKSMAETIAKSSWKSWPAKDDSWAERIADADYSQSEQPIVKAFKAEALLESGKAIDFALPGGTGDEKPYIDYVRGLSAASTKKRTDLTAAAQALVKLPNDASWLVLGRRERAAAVLQKAANELLRSPDGSPRLFESAADAAQAYAWLDKSAQLEGKSAKEAGSLPWEAELTLALAAASKTPPAFGVTKSLGENLFAKNRDNIKEIGRVYLVLADPADFAAELKTIKSAGLLGVREITEMLQLGDSQLDVDTESAELKQRQGLLYALKAWQLEQAEKKDNHAIYAAYNKAYSFDPTNPAILMARGRLAAAVALALAAKESDSAEKIKTLQKGARDCDVALKKNLVNDDGWADLCLERSQLALELGNEYAANKEIADAKSAFLDAKQYAEKAQDAKTPPKDSNAVLIALGNALEDLAHFANVDVDKNYAAAAKVFDAATAKSLDLSYNAGRTRYRWASDKDSKLTDAERKATFQAALLNFFPVASNPKSEHAAEAGYWEGFTHWYLGDLKKAFDSLDRTIPLGVKSPKTTVWSRFALDGVTGVTRAQLAADSEKAAEWAAKTERSLRGLRPDAGLKDKETAFYDVAAEANWDVAKKNAKTGDPAKFRSHGERAVEFKHSTRGHLIAIERAALAKANKTFLGLSPQDLTTIFNQTISAINAAPSLDAAQKQQFRNDFETNWKKF